MLTSGPDRTVVGQHVAHNSPEELIRIALGAGLGGFETFDAFETAFCKAIGCDPDYARRLLKGSRPLRDNHRDKIRSLLGLPMLDLDVSARDLAVIFGLSRERTEELLSPNFGVFDFASRTADHRSARQLFGLIGGYWELIFWSFSRRDEQAVSRELLIVDRIDPNNLLRCRVTDVNFAYSGVIFPVLQHLYIFMEKDRLYDEVVVYLTNRPDRAPPVLRGITLGLSGGVDELHAFPTASKVAFRFLGRTAQEVRRHYPDAPEAFLATKIVCYLTRNELDQMPPEEKARLQVARIDNRIEPDAVPFVLRADR
jgi:hypothetical protein